MKELSELSVEEKAKRFDEVIEMYKARQEYECRKVREFMEYLFPELKESEDEKIRKELITHCRNIRCVTEEGAESIAKWIAWLEKQGEQKSFARYKVGDTIYYDSFGRLVSFVIANIVEDGTDNPMYEDKDGNSVFQNDIVDLDILDSIYRDLKKLRGE